MIFEAAAQAGLDIQFLTAPEVYDLLVTAEAKPGIDLVATYLKPADRFRARTRAASQRAPAPFAPARALELVRETTAAVLAQRIDALGVRGSGAYEHYSDMLKRGFPIPHHELIALQIVRRQAPQLSAYHEIGSGIGILPFLLALNGFPAVGIECDPRRHETALAIWRDLSAKAKAGKPACRLVLGRFPFEEAKYDRSDALAILTDFVTTQTPKQMQAIFDGLRYYPYVLLDLRRFCLIREESETQLELLRELGEHGFTQLAEIAPATDCAFVLLRNEAIKLPWKFAVWSWLKLPWGSQVPSHHTSDRP